PSIRPDRGRPRNQGEHPSPLRLPPPRPKRSILPAACWPSVEAPPPGLHSTAWRGESPACGRPPRRCDGQPESSQPTPGPCQDTGNLGRGKRRRVWTWSQESEVRSQNNPVVHPSQVLV